MAIKAKPEAIALVERLRRQEIAARKRGHAALLSDLRLARLYLRSYAALLIAEEAKTASPDRRIELLAEPLAYAEASHDLTP